MTEQESFVRQLKRAIWFLGVCAFVFGITDRLLSPQSVTLTVGQLTVSCTLFLMWCCLLP